MPLSGIWIKYSVMFDVEKVRRDFPILGVRVYDKPLVYLDSGATAQKPECVIETVDRLHRESNANIHRGVHFLSEEATEMYEAARARIAEYIGAEARVALTGAVAVEGDRLFLGQQGLHGFGELVRAGDAGVAQRVVEHVLIADLGGALFAVHEGLADDALVAQHGAVSLVQHNTFPLFLIDPLPAEWRHSSAPPSPYSSIPGPAP